MINKKTLKYVGVIFIALMLVGAYVGYVFYGKIFKNNVDLKGKDRISIYVPSTADEHEFKNILRRENFLVDQGSFWWVAKKKGFSRVFPGHYVIRKGMSNNSMVNMFRSGLQTPVKIVVPSVRTKDELAGRLAKYVEADSIAILGLLNNESFLDQFGLTPENSVSFFLPDTYEVYWNLDAEGLFRKMKSIYDKFWTAERVEKAKKAGLTKLEVTTLASIVQSEQSKFNDEKRIIAGLYINRMQKGIRLESCPTLIFAKGDFTVQRVLNKDKEIVSPYNTYKNSGLPPGPINIPRKSSINAVLDYTENDYLFMCAKDDFSGRHYFSKTYSQHSKYARKFQKALNRRGIKR